MLPTKFQVHLAFGSGEETKNSFSKWPLLEIRIGSILAISWSPQCFLPSFKLIDRFVQEWNRKIDFQDGRDSAHLGFQIETILAFFFVQVTPMLLTKFHVNRSRHLGVVGFLSKLLMPQDGRRTTDDGHRLITIAHLEHFVLR